MQSHPLKYVQQQTRWSRTRTISTVNSYPMHTNLFTPVAFETSDVCGPCSMSFLTDLGRRIVNTAGDKSSLELHTFCKCFLFPIRGGILASSLGALPPTPSPMVVMNMYILWFITVKKKRKKDCSALVFAVSRTGRIFG